MIRSHRLLIQLGMRRLLALRLTQQYSRSRNRNQRKLPFVVRMAENTIIAKGSEDLRQDERIQRLYRAMDSLLTQSPSARAKSLRIRTFHVLPLTRRSGLIEFVHRTEPVGRILLNSSDVAKSNIGNISVRHEAFIKARAMFGLSGEKAQRNRWRFACSGRQNGRDV